MIEVLSQIEAAPAAYPSIPGVSGIDPATIWQRIEHYTAYRFTARTVTWRVDSTGGEWTPPLRPASSVTAKRWTGAAFEAVTLAAAPDGWCLPCGRYEIEATVGAGPVPAAVSDAVARLAAYLAAEAEGPAGVRSYSANVGQLSESWTRSEAHLGRAMQNSGAADLLRPYRRA